MGILQGTGKNGRIELDDYARMTGQTQYLPQNSQQSPASSAPTPRQTPAAQPQARPQTQAPMTVSFPQQPSASNPAWPSITPGMIEAPPPREPDQPSVLQSMMQNPIYSTSGPTTANNTFGSSYTPSQVNANGQIVGSSDTRTVDQRNAALMNTTVGGKPGGGTWTMGDALAYQAQQNAPRDQAAAAAAAGNPGVLTMSPLGNYFTPASASQPQPQPTPSSSGAGSTGRITLADYAGMAGQTQYLPQNQNPTTPAPQPQVGDLQKQIMRFQQQMPQGSDYFNSLLQQQFGDLQGQFSQQLSGLQGQFSQQLGGLQQQFMQYQQEQMAQAKARDEMLERIMQAQLAAQRNAQTQQAIGSGQPVASQRPEDVNRANAPSYLTPLSTQNRTNSLSRYLAAQMAV